VVLDILHVFVAKYSSTAFVPFSTVDIGGSLIGF